MELMRLQKFLSTAGVCSRRKGEEFIKKGLVKVNGLVVDTPGSKVDPSKDRVEFSGQIVELKQDIVYIALNKPVKYETTCRKKHNRIVLDIVKIPQRVYPVGRLDKDSEGLLLLTNDGRLHHKLSHPSFEHEKEYEVTVKKPISDSDLMKMASGMRLDDFSTRPCSVKRSAPNGFSIILKEGKNRQIRRMAEHVGNDVVKLKRVRISNIRLGHIETGKWRYLTEKEQKILLKTIIS